MSISSQVQRIKGHTLGHHEKAFIITESERDPKEVNQGLLYGIFTAGKITAVIVGEPGGISPPGKIYNI